MNHTHLSCITPPLPVQSMVVYTLNLDSAPPPDFSVPTLQLSVRPDPTGFMLVTKSVPRGSNSTLVQINVSGLDPVES